MQVRTLRRAVVGTGSISINRVYRNEARNSPHERLIAVTLKDRILLINYYGHPVEFDPKKHYLRGQK